MAVPSPLDHAHANDRMLASYVSTSAFLAPTPLERVAGFIREPVTREVACVPEAVQRASILRVCADFDLRLTRIYQGSWYRPSRRPTGFHGRDGRPLLEEPGIDELARAIRHGAITAVVVSHIGVIGTLRQTRDEFYRILRGKDHEKAGEQPRQARLVVSDFIWPAPRLMQPREWVKRHELAWQGAIRDLQDNDLVCGSCGRDLELLTDEASRAIKQLGRHFWPRLTGDGDGVEMIRKPKSDGLPDDVWADRQAGYRRAITSAWMGAHVQILSKHITQQLDRFPETPEATRGQDRVWVVCPCTERSMLRGDFSEMPADRIGRTSIALDDPSAVRFTDPEYPWDRLPGGMALQVRDDPGRIAAGRPR